MDGYKTLKVDSMAAEMPHKSLPSLYLTAEDLPAIKDWEVGKTYELAIKVIQTSKNQDEVNGKKNLSARFEIKGIKVLKSLSKEQEKIKEDMGLNNEKYK
jgi:hypothetical protein